MRENGHEGKEDVTMDLEAQELEAVPGGWSLSAFLGMVASGGLSLTIALILYGVGLLHEEYEDARERKALAHFFAIEVVDVFTDTCKSAHFLVAYRKLRRPEALKMVDADLIERVVLLSDDPSFVALLRSFYGRQARVASELERAYTFFKGRRAFAKAHLTGFATNCSEMHREVRDILKIAAEEGVDQEALSRLQSALPESEKEIEAIMKEKERLFPEKR